MNQNPEQLACDAIDRMLHAAGWLVQLKQKINLAAVSSAAVRKYQTDSTFNYFNVISDYGYEKAKIDGILVPYSVFTIETKITK